MEEKRPFIRKAFLDEEHLIGARWWQDGLLYFSDPASRRQALTMLAIGGGVLAGGAGLISLIQSASAETFEDALALQRREGWSTGETSTSLAFPGALSTTVDGSSPVKIGLSSLLSPSSSALQPYYVPTLFQSLDSPSNSSLRNQMAPVCNPPMRDTFERAQRLLREIDSVDTPGDVAIIVDMSGAYSVAFAAGLAARCQPVFSFDNWPHPKGVVQAHITLGAVIYYLPLFVANQSNKERLPLFVLDEDRLASYTDESGKFDNRYLAKLPTTENLKSLGIKKVLYVTQYRTPPLRELDDLNADFVAYQASGIDVKLLDLKEVDAPKEGQPPVFWARLGWATPPPGVLIPPLSTAGYRPAARATQFSGVGMVKTKPKSFGAISSRSGSRGRSSSFFSFSG